MQNAFEAKLVAFKRGYGFLEELFGVLVTRVDTRDVDLLPLYGNIVGLEDCLD